MLNQYTWCRFAVSLIFVALPSLSLAQTYPAPANFPACTVGTASGGGPSQYCLGPADHEYVIRILKVGFERDDGAIFWYGAPSSFNIANSSAGADVGAFVSGIALPPGRYVAFRGAIDLTQRVRGSAVTVNGTAVSCGGGAALSASRGYAPGETCVNQGVAAPFEENVNPGSGCIDAGTEYFASPLATALVVSASSASTIAFGFDVSRGILYDYNGSTCTASAPGWAQPTISIAP